MLGIHVSAYLYQMTLAGQVAPTQAVATTVVQSDLVGLCPKNTRQQRTFLAGVQAQRHVTACGRSSSCSEPTGHSALTYCWRNASRVALGSSHGMTQ